MRRIPAARIRPVLAADPRWTASGAVFAVGDRDVAVDGDPVALRSLLDACDGATTVERIAAEHGDAAAAVVDGLLEAGVLTDAEQGWRRFHRSSSNPTRWHSDADADEIAALLGETFAPSRTVGDGIALAPPATTTARIAHRRSSAGTDAAPHAVGWDELSALLACGYGRAPAGRFTVPSAGALYGMVLHVLLRRPLGPLAPGTWWYDPWRAELRRQGEGPPDIEALLAPQPAVRALVAAQQPVVTVSLDLRRPSRKYGARAYRLALLEAGAVMQMMYLAAAELGVPVRACTGFADDGLAHLLALPDGVVPGLVLLAGA